VQAVELAQHLGHRARGLGVGGVPGEQLDPGAEHVGFLLVQALAGAAGEQQRGKGNQGQEPGAGSPQAAGRVGQAHTSSRVSMTAPGTSKPVWSVISTMQVGLVTLISVSRSPITSRPTMSSPRATGWGQVFGDGPLAVGERHRHAAAAGGEVAAGLAGHRDARQRVGMTCPPMISTRLSPALIAGR
jgi:hypothetical protein